MIYRVIVTFGANKVTTYIAPSTAKSPVEAAFEVARLWSQDFSKNDISSVEVKEETHE